MAALALLRTRRAASSGRFGSRSLVPLGNSINRLEIAAGPAFDDEFGPHRKPAWKLGRAVRHDTLHELVPDT